MGSDKQDSPYYRGNSGPMRHMKMTPAEAIMYGDRLTVWNAIRLLQAWSPLLHYGQQFLATDDPYRKSLIVGEAAGWLAEQTDSKADDELVALLQELMQTPEAKELVSWIVDYWVEG